MCGDEALAYSLFFILPALKAFLDRNASVFEKYPVIDPDLTKVVFNSSWMEQMTAADLIRLASHHTPPLTVAEHWDWVVSERVNDNGIGVDTTFAAAATEYAEAELEERARAAGVARRKAADAASKAQASVGLHSWKPLLVSLAGAPNRGVP